MKKSDFKLKLQVDVPTLDSTNCLLSKLDLFPLQNNVQAYISEDNKYLNLQLKNSSDAKHILFQFPLETPDYSSLKNRKDYYDLIKRYNLYINSYVHEIKEYAKMERSYLQKQFPELLFNIKIRIKSYDSYLEKLNINLNDGKDLYINDIIAERIIISSYNNCTDEDLLIKMSYKVAKALYDFRLNTKFRMKKVFDSDYKFISKDYIQYPKANGYRSIHILIENIDNKDLTYETQIRTFDMENISKTSGEIAHNKYKPRILNDLSPNRVPIYSEITCFNDENSNPIIFDIPLENSFYHFYNCKTYNQLDYSESKGLNITYKKFLSEKHQLENLLGITFCELRNRLKNISENQKEVVR